MQKHAISVHRRVIRVCDQLDTLLRSSGTDDTDDVIHHRSNLKLRDSELLTPRLNVGNIQKGLDQLVQPLTFFDYRSEEGPTLFAHEVVLHQHVTVAAY